MTKIYLTDEILGVLATTYHPMTGYEISRAIKERREEEHCPTRLLFGNIGYIVWVGSLYRALDVLANNGQVLSEEHLDADGRKRRRYWLS